MQERESTDRKFGSTRIIERFTLRVYAARLPHLASPSRRTRSPETAKPASGGPCDPARSRETLVCRSRELPKTRAYVKRKSLFSLSGFLAPIPGPCLAGCRSTHDGDLLYFQDVIACRVSARPSRSKRRQDLCCMAGMVRQLPRPGALCTHAEETGHQALLQGPRVEQAEIPRTIRRHNRQRRNACARMPDFRFSSTSRQAASIPAITRLECRARRPILFDPDCFERPR
jgi:hypothetical protein